MEIKRGVRARGMSPEILLAIVIAEGIWESLGSELVITSLTDGRHGVGSYHHTGDAVDLRLPRSRAPEAANKLSHKLGEGYDVVLEGNHIHVEYDPD